MKLIPGDVKRDLLGVFHSSETSFSSPVVVYTQNSMVEEETLLLQGSEAEPGALPTVSCHQQERQVGLLGTGACKVITPLMFNVLKNH